MLLTGFPDQNNTIVNDNDCDSLPFNTDLEQALIGALLISQSTYDAVCDVVGEKHFYEPLHADLFSLISERVQGGLDVNTLVLGPRVESWTPVAEDLTVKQYLARLAVNAGLPQYVRGYAQEIVELATRRALVEFGRRIASEAMHLNENVPTKNLLEEAEASLAQLGEVASRVDTVTMHEAMCNVVREMLDAYKAGGKPNGLMPYLAAIRNQIQAFAPGNVYVIAGRPAMGKTALALNLANDFAQKQKEPVGIFSMEMPAEQIALREMARISGISADVIRSGDVEYLTETRTRSVMLTTDKFKTAPLHIDKTPGLTLERLAARSRRMYRRHKTKLFVVDYLQLMAGSTRGEGRTRELSHITAGIKSLAKELGAAFILLSQLSRAVESREDKRPQLSDLRESGSIEQDADVVMALFREQYYLERAEPKSSTPEWVQWQAKSAAAENKAEIIFLKNRNGKTEKRLLHWDGPKTYFSDWAFTEEGR